MIELAKKYTTYGDCEFQDKQHLKEPAIFSVDTVTREGFELPPCLIFGRQKSCLSLFSWIILDRCILETVYVGRCQPVAKGCVSILPFLRKLMQAGSFFQQISTYG